MMEFDLKPAYYQSLQASLHFTNLEGNLCFTLAALLYQDEKFSKLGREACTLISAKEKQTNESPLKYLTHV